MANFRTLALTFALCATVVFPLAATKSAIAQTSQIEFLVDADGPAQIWAENHPDGIAVSIRVGGETEVPPHVIEQALRADFASHGVQKLRFFWEKGGQQSGSSVSYHSRRHVWGPVGLADSREQVAETAAQFTFELQRGLN